MAKFKYLALISLFLFIGIPQDVFGQELPLQMTKSYVEKRLLDKVLEDYDPSIRPSPVASTDEDGEKSDAVIVAVNMYLRKPGMDLDDENEEMRIHLTFRQEWNDSRLAFEEHDPPPEVAFLSLEDVNRIWSPDTFFSNEKESTLHDTLRPNQYLRIFPNGRVLFSIRISMTLGCPMDLSDYPFDTQTCDLKIASYGFVKDDVEYIWKETNPIQTSSNTIELSDFTLGVEDIKTMLCDSTTTTGTYSCLKVEFELERKFEGPFKRIFLPSIFLVIISWVSFWLLPTAVTARVLIGLSTIISLAVVFEPMLGQSSTIDCWAFTCLIFAFVAFLEFTAANYFTRYERPDPVVEIRVQEEGKREIRSPGICSFPKKCSLKLDYFARILFPLAFIAYNVLFWIWHIISASLE